MHPIYWTIWPGSYANNYLQSKSGFKFTYLNGTNCTISLVAFFPWLLYNPWSPSNFVILSKFALPTPTIITDNGKLEASNNKLIVFYISWI
jgi:hypothetical protein